MKLLLTLACLFVIQCVAAQKPDFYWHWQRSGDSLVLSGVVAGGNSRTLSLPLGQTIRRFGTLYRIADGLEYERAATFFATADTLSRTIVAPFAAGLAKAGRVVLVMDTALLALPVEFLNVGTTPLAIYCPLLFRISTDRPLLGNPLVLRRGYLLRDTSADPENACRAVQRMYPGSELRLAHREKLLKIPPHADFAVFSTHGLVDSASGHGALFLNSHQLNVNLLFAGTQLRLLYIDACQQGVSRTLVQTLIDRGTARWLLAPAISNDSGESSTRTMTGFFGYLKAGADPAQALWRTRRDLYAHYRKGWLPLDRINKSLIFRAYLF